MKLSNKELAVVELISNYTGYDIPTVRNILRGMAYLVNLALLDETNEKNTIVIPFIGELSLNIREIVKNGIYYKITPDMFISEFIEGEVQKIKSGESSEFLKYHGKNTNKFIGTALGLIDEEEDLGVG